MDAHQILGVPYGATQDEVKKAFRKLAHIHHPDKGGDEAMFKKISSAYSELQKKDSFHVEFRGSHQPTPGRWKRADYVFYDDFQTDINEMMKKQQEAIDKLYADLIKQQKQTQKMNDEAFVNFFHGKWTGDGMDGVS